MSSFGDEQLNYMAQSLEQIEVYMARIAQAMEQSIELQATMANLEYVDKKWKRIYHR